jgi:acetolactate synthase-1/3 small subunit
MRKHVISVLVENKFGVLARISGLFSARGYNIDSLCVAETLDHSLSKMTIVTEGDDQVIEQINKQLNKLVDIVKVLDFTGVDHVDRELLLIKVAATDSNRSSIIEITDIFRAKVVDVAPKSLTVEITGTSDKVNAFLELLRPYGIREIARTGRIAMSRGSVG